MKKFYGLFNEWFMRVYFCLWEKGMGSCVGGSKFLGVY